ncbi:MAG: hypothetical protein JNN22_14855 [Rhodospirillales bacterium]|nr:hypothetical protein [Rhodospirillales bacterium]
MTDKAAAKIQQPYKMTDRDRADVDRYFERARTKPAAPKMKLEAKGRDVKLRFLPLGAHDGDRDAGTVTAARLTNAFGGCDLESAEALVTGLLQMAPRVDGKPSELQANRMLAMVSDLAPADAHEAVLITQMVATHEAIMSAHRKLAHCETVTQQDSNGRLLNQLQRTYAAQLEALSKYRNRGKQEVRVVHQHVNVSANQAVVGINARHQGGGVPDNSKEQPHEGNARTIEHDPTEPMPSALETHARAVPQSTG